LLRWSVLKLLPTALRQDGGDHKTSQELASHLFTTPKAMQETPQAVTAEDDPMPIPPAMLTCRRIHGDHKELAARCSRYQKSSLVNQTDRVNKSREADVR
jgi:hypothetical protein